MRHIYACACGAETECNPGDLSLGGRAWVKISDQDVSFHDLLGRNHEDDDDEIDFGLPART